MIDRIKITNGCERRPVIVPPPVEKRLREIAKDAVDTLSITFKSMLETATNAAIDATEKAQEVKEDVDELLESVDQLKDVKNLFYKDEQDNTYPFYILIQEEEEDNPFANVNTPREVLEVVAGVLRNQAKGALHIVDLQVALRGLASCRYLFSRQETSDSKIKEYLWTSDGYYVRTVTPPLTTETDSEEWAWFSLGMIPTSQIENEAVTTPKIADGNVTSAKLATDSVTTPKIEAKAVTTPKIADKAIDGRTLSDKIHSMIERLVARITNNKAGQTLEIDGTTLTMSISGTAAIETYGDDDPTDVDAADMTSKAIKINDTTIANDTSATYTIPTGDSAVKRYTAEFELSYNGVTKSASSYTDVNLRKFMGFCSSEPVERPYGYLDEEAFVTGEEQGEGWHFSNSVECTVEIQKNESSQTGYEYIYIAVPVNMTVSRIEQPDALNAPIAFIELYSDTHVLRVIGGVPYTYRLYRSTDMIACSAPKRITIK